MRIDHDRLDAVLPPRDGAVADGQWGNTRSSTEPAGEPRPEARFVAPPTLTPTTASSDAQPSSEAADTTPTPTVSRSARAEAAMSAAQTTRSSESEPPPATAAARVATASEPVPLDAEVVVLMPPAPAASAAAAPAARAPAVVSHAAAPRPPVLASEALLRDMAPAEPAPRMLRGWPPVLGTVGALGTYWLTAGHGMGVPLIGAFVALGLLGLPPMPYAARAWAVVMVSGSALSLLLWSNVDGHANGESTLLTVVVTVLAAGLYFRAWHRGSNLARALVLCGTLGGATFLWTSGALSDLTMLDTAWQSWAPRLLGVPFGMLLMLALLAFMDARTTGGTSVCATALLLWYGLYTYVELMQAVWPKGAASANLALAPLSLLLSWVSGPPLTAALALGLSQVLAAALAGAVSVSQLRRSQWPT